MALEFNARADYEYQGGDTVFSVPFSYINKSHIVVILNNDEPNPVTDFSWLSENEIRINIEINTGDIVSVRRITPIKDKLVKFTDNNILDEETQNLAQEQVVNVVQEVRDNQLDLMNGMQDFVNIKDAVQENMNALNDLRQRADDVVEFDKEVKETFDGISSTYEDLKAQVKNGLNVQSNKNLFSLEVTDRTLDENELSGLCEQGKSFSADVYPDAYSKILNEYEQGEEKVFTSEEGSILVKKFQGAGEPFYFPNVELGNGVTCYADVLLTEEIGQVSDYGSVTSKEYLSNTNEKLYIDEASELSVGTSIYSNIGQISLLGSLSAVKEVNAYEYTLSTSGKVYYPTSMSLLKGRPMYSDITMETVKGTITKLETIKADKYAYNDVNGEEQIFYVPEGTILAQGTEIFSNPELTQSAGNITAKGSQSSKHYYKMVCGTGYGKAVYFYTKTAIPTSSSNATNTYLYKDVACTKKVTEANIGISQYNNGQLYIKYLVKNTNSDTKSKYPFRAGLYPTVHNILWVEALITLISSATAQNYICLNDDTFKAAYYKSGTVEAEVIALDNGINESYSLTSMVETTAIKIEEDTEYKLVNYQGFKTALVFKLDNHTYQNGAVTTVSSSGIVIPYKEYSNGHKIVTSQYENALLSYKENHNELAFYMLDTENRTVTVPILDSSKNIYFCVGNTMIARSAIQPVDKAYVDTNFATKEYVEGFLPKSLLESLGEIVTTYNATLGEIELTLDEILGEEDTE